MAMYCYWGGRFLQWLFFVSISSRYRRKSMKLKVWYVLAMSALLSACVGSGGSGSNASDSGDHSLTPPPSQEVQTPTEAEVSISVNMAYIRSTKRISHRTGNGALATISLKRVTAYLSLRQVTNIRYHPCSSTKDEISTSTEELTLSKKTMNTNSSLIVMFLFLRVDNTSGKRLSV